MDKLPDSDRERGWAEETCWGYLHIELPGTSKDQAHTYVVGVTLISYYSMFLLTGDHVFQVLTISTALGARHR